MITTLAILLSGVCFAQTLSLSGPASAKQGGTMTLQVNLAGSTATGSVALQWTLVPPSGFAVPLATAGTASTAASKTVACNAAKCLVYGVNQNVVGAGPVATISIPVPAGATPGPASFSLSSVLGADKSANSMTITTGAALPVTILAIADINGDGVIDVSDVNLMAAQVLSGSCTDDPRADGKCDLFDVLTVVLRALGL